MIIDDILTTIINSMSPFTGEIVSKIIVAIGAVIIALIIGKVSRKLLTYLNNKTKITDPRAINSLVLLIEWFMIIIGALIALNLLGVTGAGLVVNNILILLPAIISLILLLLLGIVIINTVIDITIGLLYRLGLDDYLASMGISQQLVKHTFFIIKVFLFLVVLSSSLAYVKLYSASIDAIVTALIYGTIALSAGLIFVIFKEPMKNFFTGIYIEKNLISPGEKVKIGQHIGEVLSITNHGVLMKLPTGFNVFVPNSAVIHNDIYIKRSKIEISKLDKIRSKYISSAPEHDANSLLSLYLYFVGINKTKEEISEILPPKRAKEITNEEIIKTIQKVSEGNIVGANVKYAHIHNLKEEVKSWISEGAMVLLWHKKQSLFNEQDSKSDKYVLCVGVEGDELVLMDSSLESKGVYLVDHRLIEESAISALGENKGYIVFAQKGSSAYWRVKEGLIYSDIDIYSDLSKTFERYLKKIARRRTIVYDILAEPVLKMIKTEENEKEPKEYYRTIDDIKEEMSELR